MKTDVWSSGNRPQGLRLFMLRYGKRGAIVRNSLGQITYYDNKEVAKRARNELNEGANPPIFVVSNGPDHRPAKRNLTRRTY